MAAWRIPHGLAPIHPGARRYWEAIRVPAELGESALQLLLADGTKPGPVLADGRSVTFLVPPLHHPWGVLLTGIAATATGPFNWGELLTTHLGDGSEPLLCPQPGFLHRKGPKWWVEPDGTGTLTFTGRLAAALSTAFQAIDKRNDRPRPQNRPNARPTAPANFAAFVRRQPSTAEAS
ncbi:hypothetical protein LN042_23160 [Kitasatospora sp. RB6PN24]|uniref:hypothetical protein n=1 Tax=Kitasatospora humi TaxID=2893891 RepID=UPI001E581D8A|nr:hypothetical protein [Kitasatospora humi]MCC9309936.1 hypothetical protein [Kitasatospora humi]